jgi:hypothetical protein
MTERISVYIAAPLIVRMAMFEIIPGPFKGIPPSLGAPDENWASVNIWRGHHGWGKKSERKSWSRKD